MSNTTNETKRPTHAIFQVRDGEDKSHWTRIGSAWLNKDGKGSNLVFDAFPLNGRVVMREIEIATASEDGEQ